MGFRALSPRAAADRLCRSAGGPLSGRRRRRIGVVMNAHAAVALPVALKVTLGQASERGRKAVNQDFHGACVPAQPRARQQGHRAGAGRRHRQQRGEPRGCAGRGAQRARGLLLHVGRLERQALDAARADRHQFMAARADPARAAPARSRSRLRVRDERAGDQGPQRARVPRRRHAGVPPAGQHARAADRGPSRAGGRRPELPQSRARFPGPPRPRLCVAAGRARRLFMLASDGVHEHVEPVRLVAIVRSHGDDLDGAARAIVAQALGSGSPDNLTVQLLRRGHAARSPGRRGASPARRVAAAAAAARRARCSTATASSASCMPATAATSTWRPTSTAATASC